MLISRLKERDPTVKLALLRTLGELVQVSVHSRKEMDQSAFDRLPVPVILSTKPLYAIIAKRLKAIIEQVRWSIVRNLASFLFS
jgi:hypothetical protein